MLNIFARVMMTASRCEPLKVVRRPDNHSCESDTDNWDCCIIRGGLNRVGLVAVCQAAASNKSAMNAISPWTPGCL